MISVVQFILQDCMKRIFSSCGKVLHVYFHDRPNAGPPRETLSKNFPEFKPVKVQNTVQSYGSA